jgi:putative heme-binding domain-containing protein
MKAMQDNHPRVREHGVRLAEEMIAQGKDVEQLQTRMALLTDDPDILVRYQLALTVGKVGHPERAKILLALAHRDLKDRWMQMAILSALSEGAGEFFDQLISDSSMITNTGIEFLSEVASIIGQENNAKTIDAVIRRLTKSDQPATRLALARALAEGLHRADKSILDAGPAAEEILSQAKDLAADAKMPESVRVDAIALLGFGEFDAAGPTLAALLDPAQPQAIQLAALEALANFSSAKVAEEVISRSRSMSPRVRGEAIAILLKRPARAAALLKAIERGDIRASELDAAQIRFLQSHPDSVVKELAVKVLAAPTTQRQDVVDAFMPALKLTGDAAHGKTIYAERCISCHRIEDQGFALGPDLKTVQNTGREKMLINILEPNREVAGNFTAYVVNTKDGESVIGLITNESPASVTVRQAYGKESTIARDKIKQIKSQGRSLMPEGLEVGLKPQDFADLLEYLSAAK